MISEVFTYRQYSDGTLLRLHLSLTNNPQSRIHRTPECKQLARVREEMTSRGLIQSNTTKP